MKDSELDENIDFKPLSSGLGFHQKKVRFEADNLDFAAPHSKAEITKPTYPSFDLSDQFGDELKEPKKKVVKNQNSWGGDIDLGLAPKEDGVVDRDTFSNPTVVDNPFYVPKKVSSPVEVVTLRFSGHDGIRKDNSKPIKPSLLAIMMDVLTLISLCMIFSTLYFASTGKSLTDVILAMPYNGALKSQFFALTLSIGFLYLIVARCFFGRTIGEWMYHLHLGSLCDQDKATYPLRVFIRTFVIFISGFVLFPILSHFFNKDLLVYFSGLELHGEKI